jgi:hypothetical protein
MSYYQQRFEDALEDIGVMEVRFASAMENLKEALLEHDDEVEYLGYQNKILRQKTDAAEENNIILLILVFVAYLSGIVIGKFTCSK